MGDIIVSASFVSCVKEIFPQARIDWYVDARFCAILEHSDVIDCLYVLPLKHYMKSLNFKALFKELGSLRTHVYDYVIDMQGLIKSAWIGKLFQTRELIGFDFFSAKESLASFAYSKKVRIAYEDSILRRNSKLLFEALPMQMSFEDFFDFALQKRKKIFGYEAIHKEKILKEFFPNKKHLLFILESSLLSKTYCAKHFIELGAMLQDQGVAILLLYYEDFAKAKEIYDALREDIAIKILPKMDLNCIKALVDLVDLVIGGDTGITHLAWAMQTPSITLYGNTPLKRFQLIGEKNFALSKNAQASYKKNDFSINQILPQEILPYIKEVLC